MPAENLEPVVTTAVLEDLAMETALVVEVGQQIALAKAANLLLTFQGQPHFLRKTIVGNEPRERVRVGGFDAVLGLCQISPWMRFDRTLAISSVTSLSPSHEIAVEAQRRTKFRPRTEIWFQTRLEQKEHPGGGRTRRSRRRGAARLYAPFLRFGRGVIAWVT